MKGNRFSLDFEDNSSVSMDGSEVDKAKLEAFARGASSHSTNMVLNKTSWRNEDPYADPSFTTTLRLNAYEVGLLREAAKKEARSLNNLIRKIIVQELEKIITQK